MPSDVLLWPAANQAALGTLAGIPICVVTAQTGECSLHAPGDRACLATCREACM